MTRMTPPLDERGVMRELSEGSHQALVGLYDRTASVLYSLAFRIVNTRERASVVLEDLFDEIWRDRERWPPASAIPMGAMIARCRELALAQMGSEARRPMTASTWEPERTEAISREDAGLMSERSTADIPTKDFGPFVSLQAATDALKALAPQERLALEEAFFRGTSAREIATLVGAPTSDAAALLRQALVRFREHLDQPVEVEAPTGTET